MAHKCAVRSSMLDAACPAEASAWLSWALLCVASPSAPRYSYARAFVVGNKRKGSMENFCIFVLTCKSILVFSSNQCLTACTETFQMFLKYGYVQHGFYVTSPLKCDNFLAATPDRKLFTYPDLKLSSNIKRVKYWVMHFTKVHSTMSIT